MKSIANPFTRLLDRVQRRYRTARPGSVLILVVALLVLMALLGTAYISTTRIDRYTARQHATNVQIDLLVEGVVNLATSAIGSDLKSAAGVYRPGDTAANLPSGYEHFDFPGAITPIDPTIPRNTLPQDVFLAARFPRPGDSTAAWASGSNPAVWDAVTYPLIRTYDTAYPYHDWRFDSPDTNIATWLSAPFYLAPAAPTAGGNYNAKPLFEPTFKSVNGVNYPAFQGYYRNNAGNPVPFGNKFLVADADGDGVADSGLWKLPVGRIDGVTYYAAVRIIDNNSAINVNTAWSNLEFAGNGAGVAPPRYFFPGSVGLAELLRTYNPLGANAAAQSTEMFQLVRQRFNNADPTGVAGGVVGQPVDDAGGNITGFEYGSLQDLLNSQLGNRLANPGSVAAGPVKAQKMSDSDAVSLAYHFCLINPDATPSPLEALLYNADIANNSIYGPAVGNFGSRQSSYPISQAGIDGWFQNNFDFFAETLNTGGAPQLSFRPRRSMLVTGSPVSNQAPARPLPQFALDAGIVVPPIDLPKTSINQAPFADLWRAFLQVMIEPVELSPGAAFIGSPVDVRTFYAATKLPAADIRPSAAPATDPPTINNPYLGTTFGDYNAAGVSYAPFQNLPSSFNPLVRADLAFKPTDYHPSRMFRSPIRAVPAPVAGAEFDANTPRLNTHQVTLLRSALAAGNTEDLRDSDNDVTAHRIILQPTVGISGLSAALPAEVIVYGTERQPYITEVYVETDTLETGSGAGPNDYGYVAVELYNPYNQDIVLQNWKLVAVDRRSEAVGGLLPPYNNGATHGGVLSPKYQIPLDNTTLIAELDYTNDIDGTPDVVPVLNAATPALIVPAGGYLLLENYDPTGATLGAAHHRPVASGLPVTGAIPTANLGTDSSSASLRTASLLPQLNVAFLPGLSGMTDPNWNILGEWPVSVRSVINRELVLLRPRRADGQYSTGTYPQIVAGSTTYPPIAYDETPNPGAGLTNLRDLVPVDSFDFTGLKLPYNPLSPLPEPLGKGGTETNATSATAWHYVRQNVEPGFTRADWKFVYPGRYDANPAILVVGADPRPRQAGTQYAPLWTVTADPDNANLWNAVGGQPPAAVSLGTSLANPAVAATNDNPLSSYQLSTFCIPLAFNNTDATGHNSIGMNPIVPPGPQQYPFGGFARNGDMMQTPFIGAYRISYQGANGSTFTVAEINSVSMDSVFAEDTDIHDDPLVSDEILPDNGVPEREQIGRFCPIRTTVPNSATVVYDYPTASGYPNINFTDYATGGVAVNDFGYDPSYNSTGLSGANWEPFWRYRWATDLFDYLAVSSPADDYLPNYPMQREFVPNTSTPYFFGDLISYYDPTDRTHKIYQCTTTQSFSGATPTDAGSPFAPNPLIAKAVQNVTTTAAAFRDGTNANLNSGTENNVPIEGLININTANWRVLSALPLIVNPGTAGLAGTGLSDETPAPAAYGGVTYRKLNEEMAKAIVYWRDVDANPDPGVYQPHGPFKSIFELNQVVDLRPGGVTIPGTQNYPNFTLAGFQNALGTFPLPNTSPIPEADDSLGDLAPINLTGTPAPDGVRGDMKERMLQLTRISNLITTRSDSFTCYILVQGWQDAETVNAKLVVQRRVGYIVDRSKVTPANTGAMVKQAFTNN